MIIDKKGKLFGKVNIIDLIVIIVLIAAVVLVGYRFLFNKSQTTQSGDAVKTVRMTLYGKEVPDFVPDKIHEGDPVSLFEKNVKMGKVVSVSKGEAFTNDIADDGSVVKVPVYGMCTVTAVIETEARVIDNEKVIIEDTDFVVGANNYINLGMTRALYSVQNIEVVG